MERIAVESSLTSIQKRLQQQGYRVDTLSITEMTNTNPTNYDAMVVAGKEKDVQALAKQVQNCPVIHAAGLTPEEVSRQVAQTVQRY